jgi:tRNA threonylcarbamoyladenosine biosynthesis protein TsaE
MVIQQKLMIRHMEKGRNEYSLETLPILVERLHEMLKETKVLDLHGEMGAGKTTLVIELLKKMGVQDPEGSPTYSLINEYLLENGSKIYHIDAFRINSTEEANELGLDELFEENAFFFVEWAEKIINFLPERRITLTISTNASLTRTYSITHDHGS